MDIQFREDFSPTGDWLLYRHKIPWRTAEKAEVSLRTVLIFDSAGFEVRRMNNLEASVFVALLSWTQGCGDPTGLGPCSGTIELTVTGGGAPEFNWAPCGLNTLAVADAAGRVMWTLHAPDTANSLLPPISYGQRPPGAVEDSVAVPLKRGFGYVVRVFRIEHHLDEILFLKAGEANFRY